MSGSYRMYRGWLDHPAFGGEPFDRRSAWVWLIDHAAWKPHVVAIPGGSVSIARGQLCHSLRFMAKAWRWDEAKVRRFLDRLRRDAMIECVADAGQTVVTICNYSRYQDSARVDDAPTDAPSTQDRRSTDAKKKEGNKEIKETAADAGARLRVGKRVLELIGIEMGDPRWRGDLSRVAVWLAQGADPELDIYPTITAVMGRREGAVPRTLTYFDQAIADAVAARLKPMPEGDSSGNRSRGVPARRDPHAEQFGAFGAALDRLTATG